MIPRAISPIIFSNQWGRQMRFIAGPRQSGKTTLAKQFLKEQGSETFYYNWDDRNLRMRFAKGEDFLKEDLLKARKTKAKKWVCYDEIHKLSKWKNILKAHFDAYEKQVNFIITGSARLDFFRRSGDSLAGRYFLFRLFPLNLFELTRKSTEKFKFQPDARKFIEERLSQSKKESQKLLDGLLRFSGFPEPFLKASPRFLRIWQRNYLDRLVREDLRDLTRIGELENVARLVSLLPERIGSPLSVNSLREDLLVSHETVRGYLQALKLCYFIFEVAPYSRKISRSLKKEKKVYYHDWSLVSDPGKRFENYIACELTSWISSWHDAGIGNFDLRYIRMRDGKECDFLITKDEAPWLLVEAKLSHERTASHLLHLAKTLDVPFLQLVLQPEVLRVGREGDFCVSASRFLSA